MGKQLPWGRLLLAVTLVAMLVGSGSAPSYAAYTVNSTLDEPDATVGDGHCLSTPSGMCTLRAAVAESNGQPLPRTVTVPSGRFVLALGAITLRDIELIGAEADRTVIDGDLNGAVFSVEGTVTLSGLTVTRGSASGIVMTASSTLTLMRVAIIDNASTLSGGGVRNGSFPRSSLTVVDSLVARNVSPFNGGGIANTGTLVVRNTTVSGNSGGEGGGISSSGSGSSATLENVTVVGNAAPAGGGGGLWRDSISQFTLRNSIVADNSGGNCGGSPGFLSFGGTIDSGTTCGLAGSAIDLSNVDPEVEPLAENGGTTPTHALRPGSPAIDFGVSAGCPPADQRGMARPSDGDGDGLGRCDAGAFELQPVIPTATPTATATPIPTSTATATSTSIPTATPTLAATSTLTPTSTPGACAPRPPVAVSTSRPSFGILSSTVIAGSLPATPSNWLRRIRFSQLDNASVSIRTFVNQKIPFVLELPERPRQVNFTATWATPGAFTVRMVVEDDCGSWPTFVGAGASAF